jgi:hypothetical protein
LFFATEMAARGDSLFACRACRDRFFTGMFVSPLANHA